MLNDQTIVLNLQRKVQVEKSELQRFAERLNAAVEEARDRTFTVALVSDRRMKGLNSLFRGKDTSTDVLSFPHEADEFEAIQSASFSLSLDTENDQVKACTLNKPPAK